MLLTTIVLFQNSLFAFSTHKKEDTQFLNLKEQKWITDLNRPLRVGITQIPNQVLKTQHGYRGYSIDLFNKISSLLKNSFTYVYYDTWQELLTAAKKREVDIVFFAQKTANRLQYFNFTDTVLIQHNKIISSLNKYAHTDLKELFGKKVAIVQGSAIEEYVRINYPQIIIVQSSAEPDSLQKLLNKKASYTIVEPVRASYYMKKNNIDNLYITGDFPYDYKLRIATRSDMPTINIILNKALEHISPNEKKALALKWGYEKEIFFDKQLLITILIVFIIVLIFIFYLSLLNKKLKQAQRSLTKVNTTLEERIKQEVEKNRQKDLAMLNQSRFVQMGKAINMIAHQWRQPLNNIALIIQTLNLKSQKDKLTKEEIEKLKDKILLQTRQMSQTIDDFRDFFKEEKTKRHFYLNETLQNIIKIVEPVLEKSNISLELKDLHTIEINGYANELSQAILNIIYNAKDALIENREEDRSIEISLTKEKDKALLTIQDNAGGIPEAIIANIFDPYFSTKSKNGTGIGLYMSKIIIEEHMDGEIKAINNKEGALFSIILITSSQSSQ